MISKTLKKIVNSAVGLTDYYQNSLQISGWILQRPSFKTKVVEGKEIETCVFIIHQPNTFPNGDIFDKTYTINVLGQNNVAKIKEQCTQACFIAILGKVEWHRQIKSNVIYLLECNISSHLTIPLEETYQKGDRLWSTKD